VEGAGLGEEMGESIACSTRRGKTKTGAETGRVWGRVVDRVDRRVGEDDLRVGGVVRGGSEGMRLMACSVGLWRWDG
jgi:hypothetical protein